MYKRQRLTGPKYPLSHFLILCLASLSYKLQTSRIWAVLAPPHSQHLDQGLGCNRHSVEGVRREKEREREYERKRMETFGINTKYRLVVNKGLLMKNKILVVCEGFFNI